MATLTWQDGDVSKALEFLVDLLDLEPIEVNIFRGVNPNEDRQRVFGGQVAAQSLMAAGRTVETGRPHSLHAYFLRCTITGGAIGVAIGVTSVTVGAGMGVGCADGCASLDRKSVCRERVHIPPAAC